MTTNSKMTCSMGRPTTTQIMRGKLDNLRHLKMVLFTRENGIREPTRKMAEEFKFGLMAQDMTVSGEMVSRKAMVDSSKLKVMFMKVNGMQTKLMALVSIPTTMEIDTSETGKKTNNTEKVLKCGQMTPSMTVFTKMV